MLSVSESYTFSRATNEKKLNDLDESYGKQLIYTPVHRLNLSVGLELQGFNLLVRGNINSKTYTTRDNLEYIEGYGLMDISIGKTFNFRVHSLIIRLALDNVLNNEYQVIEYRPMPGRKYTIKLEYQFSKLKN
jgi:iron complex outermembrane receptor protein